MAGGVSVLAASVCDNICNSHAQKPRHFFNATARLGSGKTGIKARVRLTATTKASGVYGKRSVWGYGVREIIPASDKLVGHLSSRGGSSIVGSAAAALRWCSFSVHGRDNGNGNARTTRPASSRHRRAARMNTITRAIMDPAAFASFRGSLSYSDVFTTNIFAPG